MAKLGDDRVEYDPFNQISASLSALKDAPAEPREAQEPADAEPFVEPKPAPRPQGRGVAPRQEPVPPRAVRDWPANRGPGGASGRQPGRGVAQRNEHAPAPVSDASALRTTKRFKTTQQESVRLDTAAVQLGARMGVSMDVSKISRALWEVYLRHEEDILRNIEADGSWRRPWNNDAVGLAEFDERLADLINEGLLVASMRSRHRQ